MTHEAQGGAAGAGVVQLALVFVGGPAMDGVAAVAGASGWSGALWQAGAGLVYRAAGAGVVLTAAVVGVVMDLGADPQRAEAPFDDKAADGLVAGVPLLDR